MTPWLDAPLGPWLADFLPGQRWFGGKARAITACAVDDVVEIGENTAFVIAGVSYATGRGERYGLLLSTSAAGVFTETSTMPPVIAELVRGFSSGAVLASARGGALVFGDTTAAGRRAADEAAVSVRPVGAEQSNTSIRIGGSLVFKLFRKIEPGENPELEIGRFLTARTSFRAMSTLAGSIVYRAPDGSASTIGVLQSWIDNQGDGWRHVLASLDRAWRDAGESAALMTDISTLGAITADFHAALATDSNDPAFAPEPVTLGDADGWRAELAARVVAMRGLIEAFAPGWPSPTRALGAKVLASLDRVASAAPAGTPDFSKIRIHGDYHLGQTLKTASGFAIIDFEGEPARPIAARREKHAALKDVAGMLRSFDYAIQTASTDRPDAADRLPPAAGLSAAFLDGYLQQARGAATIPSDPAAFAAWLAHFQIEKALYELEYEANNRPDWVAIPLQGILSALGAHA